MEFRSGEFNSLGAPWWLPRRKKRKLGKYDREGRLKNKGGANRPEINVGRHRSFISPSSAAPWEVHMKKAKADNPHAIKEDNSICY